MNSLQINLNVQQSQILQQMAQRDGKTVSNLVEQIIQEAIDRQQRQTLNQQLARLARIREHRSDMLTRRQGRPLQVDIIAVVDELREERDDDHFQTFLNHRD